MSAITDLQQQINDLTVKFNAAKTIRDRNNSNIDVIRGVIGSLFYLPSNKYERAVIYPQAAWNPFTGAVSISSNYQYKSGIPYIEAQPNKPTDAAKNQANINWIAAQVAQLVDINKYINAYETAVADTDSYSKQIDEANKALTKALQPTGAEKLAAANTATQITANAALAAQALKDAAEHKKQVTQMILLFGLLIIGAFVAIRIFK